MSAEEDDPYAQAAAGSLKLKTDDKIGKKKKRKKDKQKKLVEVTKTLENEDEPQNVEVKRTKAELAFLKMREKLQTERIKEKASKTHKERVGEFNRHLDSLTEHFDIPKVSWTK